MRIRVVGSGLFKSDLGEPLFSQLAQIYPEGQKGGSFRFLLYWDDPTTQHLLKALRNFGWVPSSPFAEPGLNQFTLHTEREYDVDDYGEASYLVPNPIIGVSGFLTRSGLLSVTCYPEEQGLRPTDQIANVFGTNIIVSDSLKIRMEGAQFRNIEFANVELHEKPKGWKAVFWEVTSNLVLPPLSSKSVILDEDRQPWNGDSTKYYYLYESNQNPEALILQAELHYQQGSFSGLGEFDLALTRERLGGARQPQPLASKRFYKFCVENELKMQWRPVRFDSA